MDRSARRSRRDEKEPDKKKIVELAEESQWLGNPGEGRIYRVTITGAKYLEADLEVTFTCKDTIIGEWLHNSPEIHGRGVPVTCGFCAFEGGGKVNSATLLSMCSGDDRCLLVPLDFPERRDVDRLPGALLKFLSHGDIRLVVMGNALLPAGLEMPEGSESLISLVKRSGFAGPELKKEPTIERLAFVVLKEVYQKKIQALVGGAWKGIHGSKYSERDAYLTHKIAAAAIKLSEGGGSSGCHPMFEGVCSRLFKLFLD